MAAFRTQNYLYPYYWPRSHLDKHCGGSSHLAHKETECAAAKGWAELWPQRVKGAFVPSVIGQKGPFALHLTFLGLILSSPTTTKALVPPQCFQAYLSTPSTGLWKLECACPVRDNGRVSDPWPHQPLSFLSGSGAAICYGRLLHHSSVTEWG